MQLATVAMSTGQPWTCTVYFIVYNGSFYWLSYPERRHSREIADHPKVAIAIVEATQVLARYVKKYGSGQKFIELLRRGSNHHTLYKVTPRQVMLFDETQKERPAYHKIKLDD